MVRRHRGSAARRSVFSGLTGTVLISTLLITVAGGAYFFLKTPTRLPCMGSVTVRVSADPVVATALRSAADRLRHDNVGVDGTCIDAVVHGQDPATVAGQVARAASDEASRGELPDVWVPDSSLWLDVLRARERTKYTVPRSAVSIAASPVIVALTPAAANHLKSRPQIGWAQLLDRLSGRRPLVVGIPDPVSSATGIATLHGLATALTKRKAPASAATATWRALAVNAARSVSDLTRQVPRTASQPGLQAFLADEAAVWRFNRNKPRTPLVAAYPPEGTICHDYPFVVLPHVAADSAAARAAERLRAEIISARGNADLFAVGLRLPDGTAGARFGAVPGIRPGPPRTLKLPPAARTAELIRQWRMANLNARSLVLIDVSGSMAEPVREAGNASRMNLTLQAAKEGVGLFEDDNALGLWVFSTELTRRTDYREVVPIGKLSERLGNGTRRSEIIAALDRLRPKRGGATGLYDSIAAAHRTVRDSYDPGRVNSVIVLTDGRNEDPGSLTLDQLLKQLRAASNPKRPVPIFAIGFGPDIDIRVLRQIAQVTGGVAYQARDPREITELFFDAISQRTCRPHC